MPTGGIDLGIGALLTEGLGATAGGLIADAGAGALIGGTLDAAGNAITGGDPLKGFEQGAIGGGAIGLGPAVGGALGIGETAGGALLGAAGGALGSGVTGGNPLLGAAEGGVAGGISGALSGPSSSAPTTGGVSGVTPAPASISGAPAGGDVTLQSVGDFPTGVNGASTGAPSLSGPPTGGGGDLPGTYTVGGSPGGASSYAPGGSNFVSQGDSNISAGSGGNISGGGQPISGATGNSVAIPGAGTTGNNISGAGGGTATGQSSISTALSNPTFGNIGKALGSNAGLLTSGAGLLNDVVNSGPIPGEKNLKNEADQLSGQGQQLQSYLNTATLPPGVQGGINQALHSATAAIKSKYASMGMSGSSAEQQDLANAQASAATQGANIAMNLLNQGVSETQLSGQIYQELIQNTLASDKSFAESLTNLGSAVGGGGGGQSITLKAA